jgi:hypothetical protein
MSGEFWGRVVLRVVSSSGAGEVDIAVVVGLYKVKGPSHEGSIGALIARDRSNLGE